MPVPTPGDLDRAPVVCPFGASTRQVGLPKYDGRFQVHRHALRPGRDIGMEHAASMWVVFPFPVDDPSILEDRLLTPPDATHVGEPCTNEVRRFRPQQIGSSVSFGGKNSSSAGWKLTCDLCKTMMTGANPDHVRSKKRLYACVHVLNGDGSRHSNFSPSTELRQFHNERCAAPDQDFALEMDDLRLYRALGGTRVHCLVCGEELRSREVRAHIHKPSHRDGVLQRGRDIAFHTENAIGFPHGGYRHSTSSAQRSCKPQIKSPRRRLTRRHSDMLGLSPTVDPSAMFPVRSSLAQTGKEHRELPRLPAAKD